LSVYYYNLIGHYLQYALVYLGYYSALCGCVGYLTELANGI